MLRGVFTFVVLLLTACHTAECELSPLHVTLTPNLDDDDLDGRRDGLTDTVAPNDDDVAWVHLGSCPIGARLPLELSFPDEVRVFDSSGTLVVGHTRGSHGELVTTDGAIRLGFDAVRGRHAHWNGSAALVLTEGAYHQTVVLTSRRIVLDTSEGSVSSVTAVQVAHGPSATTKFIEDLQHHLLPSQVPLRLIDGDQVALDRWIQDAFEPGALEPGGPPMRVWVKLDRSGTTRGLSDWADTHWLAPGRGVVFVGGNEATDLNGGGNLELIPPHTGFPRGRLLIGGSETARRMAPLEVAWFEAQALQAPRLEVPTGWLAVGHVDELFAFLPSAHGVVVAVASPRAGLDWLSQAHPTEALAGTPVAQLRTDPTFRDFNLAAQRHISEGIGLLQAAVPALELIELPVLFTPTSNGLATSLGANAVNLVALDDVVLLPKQGSASLERELQRRLTSAGYDASFVDASAYANLGGAAHCGVLLEHERDLR